MDQFQDAVIRAEKLRAKNLKYRPMAEVPFVPTALGEEFNPVVPKLKVKTPVKRTNEIHITVFIDDDIIEFQAKTNITDLISSQRTPAALKERLKEMIRSVFGKVTEI